jgi:hypothetical protein
MTAMSAQSASAIDAANPFPEINRPASRRPGASPQPPRPSRRFPSPRFGDYSRTRFESRVAFGGSDEGEDPDEVATQARQFSLREITSGLPDDSREADEKQAERQLRGLRARVKAARAAVSTSPRLAEILQRDWRKSAQFYAKFGITEALFQNGVRVAPGDEPDNPATESPPPIAVDELPSGE